MIGTDHDPELLSADCIAVLRIYSVRELAAKSSVPEYAGWLDRVEHVPGIDCAALTAIHGILIAEGMLKFEITGRSLGLQYQLSTSGREALTRTSAVSAEDAVCEHETAFEHEMVCEDEMAETAIFKGRQAA